MDSVCKDRNSCSVAGLAKHDISAKLTQVNKTIIRNIKSMIKATTDAFVLQSKELRSPVSVPADRNSSARERWKIGFCYDQFKSISLFMDKRYTSSA